MTTPGEIRFELQRKLLSLATERGRVPIIIGVHSVVMIDDKTVSVIYDIVPDADGSGLHFEFELPRVLTREELYGFSEWLASSGSIGTVH